MKNLLIALILTGCTTDVSISKTYDNEPSADTSNVAIESDTTDTNVVADTSESSETGNSMTDLTIGFSQIYFRQVACPACIGETSEFDIRAELKFHHPTSGNYNEWLTPVGDCTTNIFESHVSSQPLASSNPAYFNAIALNPSGNGIWTNDYMYEYQYERNTSYTITSEHGTIPNAFTTVEGFDSIEPYTLFWIDPSYAFEAVISKNGTYFSWAPTVPNSQFEIMIAVYTSDGAQLLGVVSCMENDNGSMYISGTYFQSFPPWSLTAVHLTRHRFNRVAVPELNGYLESHMKWSVVGTGHIE
jgi:hypothetical protein